MNSFERFLAGEDALARLIRSQPAFEPSAEHEARVMASFSALPQTAPEDYVFEPPAAMEAVFLQEMHAVQQAQAPRRDALLSRLQSGTSADTLLGHPVSDATQTWLAGQLPVAGEVHKKITLHGKRRSWEWGGMVLAGVMLGVIGLRLFNPVHQALPVEMAVNSPVPDQQSTSALVMADKAARSASVQLDTAKMAVQPKPDVPQPVKRDDAPLSANADSAGLLQKKSMELVMADQVAKEAQKSSSSRNVAMLEMTSPAPENRQPMLAAPASEYVKGIAAKAAPVTETRIILLSRNPKDIARELPPEWAGQPLLVRAADPTSPAVQDWVEHLRAALAPGTRLTLLPANDSSLGFDSIVLSPH